MELEGGVLQRIVGLALEEDIGPGDVTCAAVVPEDATVHALIVGREAGVVAGLPVAEEVFRQVSRQIRFSALVPEGERLRSGTRVAEVSGPACAVLSGERVALNFLQRLSGIATLTRRCADTAARHGAEVLDTRKTTPGLRLLEKYAVRVAGGVNHRFGLFDQVLIKDNHLRMLLAEAHDLAGAVHLSVKRAREKWGEEMVIEVEAESLPMVEAGIEAGADIIMLDNMSLDEMSRAAAMVHAHRTRTGAREPLTEASGGVTEDRIAQVAATGVDRISLGALTHSAPALDLAMEIV